jgi:phage-related protein
MRLVLAADEKPLHWVGSSKRDFLEFPHAVKDDMGNALGIAQFGGTAPAAKPWKGQRDVELVAQRLKVAQEDYEVHHGKPKR